MRGPGDLEGTQHSGIAFDSVFFDLARMVSDSACKRCGSGDYR